MPTDKNPEAKAGLPATLNALPVGSKFNIELTDEGKLNDELQGYRQDGEITIGENVYGFSNFATQGSMQDSDYKSQWREAASLIVSGEDRTAFVTNDGGGGWGTAFSGRWLMWRDGERVYVASDDALVDPYDNAGPYKGIESLQSRCARGLAGISALSLQAIRDFLWPDPATQSILAAELTSQTAVVDEPDTEVVNEPDTETDWLDCGEDGPGYVIQQLRNVPANQRKLFLAGCGWARRFWKTLGSSKYAIEAFERFADQEAPLDGFFSDILQQFLPFPVFAHLMFTHLENDAKDAAHPMAEYFQFLIVEEDFWKESTNYVKGLPQEEQAQAERDLVLPARGVFSLSRGAYQDASDEFHFAGSDGAAEYQAQCDILRDVFGNPRPVSLEASWLTGNEGAVAKIAAAIYDERAFDRMPELAQALEASGCNNQQILKHCRSQGNHVRGCWVIDLLLAKDKLTFPLGAKMPLAFLPDQAE